MQSKTDFLVSCFVKFLSSGNRSSKVLGHLSGLSSALFVIFQEERIAEASYPYKCLLAVWLSRDLSGLEGKSILPNRGGNKDAEGYPSRNAQT